MDLRVGPGKMSFFECQITTVLAFFPSCPLAEGWYYDGIQSDKCCKDEENASHKQEERGADGE